MAELVFNTLLGARTPFGNFIMAGDETGLIRNVRHTISNRAGGISHTSERISHTEGSIGYAGECYDTSSVVGASVGHTRQQLGKW